MAPLNKKNPYHLKAIIFDCDGTLVDSEPFHFSSWQEALYKQGYSLDKNFYMKQFSGVSDTEICKIVINFLGFDCSEEVLKDKNQLFALYQKKGIAPIQPTVDFVKQLFKEKEKYGFKLAVASGARKEDILQHLNHLQIRHCFDAILSGRDDLSEYQDAEGTNKPKPYIYLKTANVLGFKPQECIAIEDSKTGIFSARDAGCMTIAIPNSYTKEQDLSQAHIKIDSFAFLSVEDFLNTMKSLNTHVTDESI
jgi:HAD superfamily hydrolase (TIGR01509 family)